MGWISVIFVHKAIDAATVGGEDPDRRQALFRVAGVSPDAPVDPRQMIPDTTFFELLERIADDDNDASSVPARIGTSMQSDDYGAFGLAFKSAPDLLGSYRRVERFGKVVTSVANFRLLPRDRTAVMAVIPTDSRRPGLDMTAEIAVSALLAISREVSRDDFTPLAVHLRRADPGPSGKLASVLSCPVHYGAHDDALEVELDVLKRPNRLGDVRISEFFDEHLVRELDDIDDRTGLPARVVSQVTDALSEGVPTLSYVAGRLGMSSRTLQRRLAEAGLAYQDLVSEARQKLAEQLLARTDYALAEVAFLAGFADQSSFTRAFRRWSGQTPATYRRTVPPPG